MKEIRWSPVIISIFFSIIIITSLIIIGHAKIIIEKEYLHILPHGRNTGSILENWLTPVVFLQVETGGLSRVDQPRFSSYGISWIEQNFLLNGINITDPFRSGYPLFEPSWESINRIEVMTFQGNNPYRIGMNWEVDFPKNSYPLNILYSSTFPGGSDSLIPEGKMDREPSFPYGATAKRRKYIISNEINGSYYINNKFYLGVETLITRREFPTLINKSGNFIDEKAKKYILTMIYKNNSSNFPYEILLLTNYNQNDNYGANVRLNNTDTLTQHNFSLHIQYNANKKFSSGKLNILSGITTRLEELESHLEKPQEIEFDAESGPMPTIGKINRINFDNRVSYFYGIFKTEAMFQMNAVLFKPDIPFSQTILTTNGDIFSTTIWDKPEECNEFVYNTMLKTQFCKTWNLFSLSGNIFFDNSTAIANGKTLLSWWGVGGKILSKLNIKKSTITIAVLHQPSKLYSSIIGFLNKKRPSGKRYINWIDLNGNGLADYFELSETNLISTTGGKYHHKSKNLKRPYQEEFSFQVEHHFIKTFKILFQVSHRIFSNYYIVNYKSYEGDYTTTADNYLIYNKPPGEDEYYLSNYKDCNGFYSGTEIHLLWNWDKTFLNITFTAYMVKSYAPIGNGPDYNDYAVITEDTASPNSRINSSKGRLSSDRAYMGNILFGYSISEELSLGLTMKYRDGEPFSQHIIRYDSYGIPVRKLNKVRGNWDNKGVGRYTFSWNFDIRLRYSPLIYGNKFVATLDVYNILGSSTEILESYKIEDEREALEAIPPRMIRFGIAILF